MLRLVSRLRSSSFFCIPGCDDGFVALAESYAQLASKRPVIVADNVFLYCESLEQKTLFDWSSFPNCAPPFEAFTIENECPGWDGVKQIGTTFLAWNTEEYRKVAKQPLLEIAIPPSKWIMQGMSWATNASGRVVAVPRVDFLAISNTGEIVGHLLNSWHRTISEVKGFSSIALLQNSLTTLCFLNCKNVRLNDATATHGPPDKWMRRTKTPRIEYKTLCIEPLKAVIKSEGGTGVIGLDKALHICRGHFRHYSEDKPLFGKYAGTFWTPQHVRGKAENGVVIKDYEVKVPA
jgi:hypothetical protein